MIAVVPSAVLIGTTGHRVSVEVHVSRGLPGFTVVGLPDAAVRESRDRVRAALLSSGFTWPNKRVTVNLAPSGVRKSGAGLDLPIAVGVMVATGQVPARSVVDTAFVGELGLDGTLRHVTGVMVLADALAGRRLVVPEADGSEAALVRANLVCGFSTLRAVGDALRGRGPWPSTRHLEQLPAASTSDLGDDTSTATLDLCDVRGQRVGRRAVEVAAAGGHHLLLVGPPGSGKTMLAQRLPDLLPPLPLDASIEVTQVHSAANVTSPGRGLIRRPPFRAPHHGASAVSLIGGGTATMRPGEISLASGGVLFLDELGEFPASVLDALRQPLEEGVVRVSRARASVVFPARFLLVAAMNPCPCGEWTGAGSCRCSRGVRARYTARISGPILDRFDLVVPLDRPDPDELLDASDVEDTAAVACRVARVRRLAQCRGAHCNADLTPNDLERWAPLEADAASMLERHVRTGGVSARGLHRVRRVARTLADLDSLRQGDGQPALTVGVAHVAEALALRAGRVTLGFDGAVGR